MHLVFGRNDVPFCVDPFLEGREARKCKVEITNFTNWNIWNFNECNRFRSKYCDSRITGIYLHSSQVTSASRSKYASTGTSQAF